MKITEAQIKGLMAELNEIVEEYDIETKDVDRIMCIVSTVCY